MPVRPAFVSRPAISGRKFIVSSGHPLASASGIRVLLDGGNAFDAALSVSAALSVVKPESCGLGGDAFILLYHSKSGRMEAINSGGRAPRKAERRVFEERGMRYIPPSGILTATIPGLVEAWRILHEKYCTFKLNDLLADAINYAEKGFPVGRKLADSIPDSKGKLEVNGSSSKIFIPNGIPPSASSLIFQKDLATTLRSLSAEGLRSFYEGAVGRSIASFMGTRGGLIADEDLRSYEAEITDPISTTYRDFTVYEQPPPSQGLILLEMLNIIEGFELNELDAARAIHLMVEAKKLAFRDRLTKMGDSKFTATPTSMMLSKEYARKLRGEIDLNHAMAVGASPPSRGDGDTTYFCITDSDGNCVSFIQSIMSSFGSGVTVDGAGILLNNRLHAFSLKEGHPNELKPGKRTMHTLNSYMLFRDGAAYMVGGTPGLDDQVQVNLQVITNVVDFHFDIQEAIEAPRWSSTPGTMPEDEEATYELRLEDRFPSQIVNQLKARGHAIKLIHPWSIGGSQAALIDHNEHVFRGGADPRRDGYAIGY